MSIQFKIFLYIIIVLSAVVHEYSHGWMAHLLGDPTAKREGRLTLNPLKHIDPFGTVLVPLFLLFFAGGFIGWAKPVPYNPYNLKGKYGSAKVGASGPGSNFFLALVFGLTVRFLSPESAMYIPFIWITYVNIFLGLFNLIPLPPLDGSKLLMDFFPRSRSLKKIGGSMAGVLIAVGLAILILPTLSNLVYTLIVGHQFLGLTF
ncbi:MAG: site-2 protease family protein [Candidatus Paceibacterota bacterium]